MPESVARRHLHLKQREIDISQLLPSRTTGSATITWRKSESGTEIPCRSNPDQWPGITVRAIIQLGHRAIANRSMATRRSKSAYSPRIETIPFKRSFGTIGYKEMSRSGSGCQQLPFLPQASYLNRSRDASHCEDKPHRPAGEFDHLRAAASPWCFFLAPADLALVACSARSLGFW